ncbi:MAG: hypothetical protein RI943_98 [Bacteroidota bacterium]|jgi:hypothetical protein
MNKEEIIIKFKLELKRDLTYENLCSMNLIEYKNFVIGLFEKLNELKIKFGAERDDFKKFIFEDIYSQQETDIDSCENRLLDLCSEISTVYSSEPFFWDSDFEMYKISLVKMLENHNY